MQDTKITDLFIKYGSANFREGTDKFCLHSYSDIYEKIFIKYKKTCKNLLEIGIASGASMAAFSEYFNDANIYGIDIIDKRMEVYKNIPRGTFYVGDALDTNVINMFSNKEYDIIIEDASHEPEHQKQHFTDFCKFVKEGGVYIIEDVHINYRNSILSHVNEIGSKYNFSCELIDLTQNKNLPDDNMIICYRKLL